MFAPVLDHHPHGTLAHFRRKLLSLLLVHGSILSKSGASGKPGAVQAVGEVLENLDTAEQQEQVFGELLLPQIVAAFAVKLNSLDETFINNDSSSLQYFWEAFLNFEHLSEFENVLAQAINDATREAYDAGINEKEEESDDAGVINGPFETLSNDERIAAVKAFLAALANAHNDMKNIQPLIKRKVGDQPDYLGNQWAKSVGVFDRSKSNFGHGPETPTTPKKTNSYLQQTVSEICFSQTLRGSCQDD